MSIARLVARGYVLVRRRFSHDGIILVAVACDLMLMNVYKQRPLLEEEKMSGLLYAWDTFGCAFESVSVVDMAENLLPKALLCRIVWLLSWYYGDAFVVLHVTSCWSYAFRTRYNQRSPSYECAPSLARKVLEANQKDRRTIFCAMS